MRQLKLSVSRRDAFGSGACKRLRNKEGKIPAIIYGKSGNEPVSVNESHLRKLVKAAAGSATLVEVTNNEGAVKLTVIEKLQREPSTGAFLHVDFHEVSADELMHATLPVQITGESLGVKSENGVLEVALHKVDVRCLPRDLPEHVVIDVTALRVGEAIHFKNLPPINGVTLLGDPETVIVACLGPSKVVEDVIERGMEGSESKTSSSPSGG